MEKNKTVEVLKRYFEVKVFGSYIFVENGLLEEKDINDIDLAISRYKEENVRAFLIDNGFTETRPPQHPKGYQKIEGSREFKKEGETTIHILISEENIFSLNELVSRKFKRGLKKDIIQLQKVINHKLSTIRPDEPST